MSWAVYSLREFLSLSEIPTQKASLITSLLLLQLKPAGSSCNHTFIFIQAQVGPLSLCRDCISKFWAIQGING